MLRPAWKYRAPFLMRSEWSWITFYSFSGNAFKAVGDKARELGAEAWDVTQAEVWDHTGRRVR